MLTCKGCGKQFEEGSKFCDICGTPLSAEMLSSPREGENSVNTEECGVPLDEGGAGEIPLPKKPRKKGKKRPILAAMGILAAAAVATAAALTLKKEPETQNDYVFYLKDDNIYYADLDLKELSPVELTSRLYNDPEAGYNGLMYGIPYLSEDGRMVFYPERFSVENYDCSFSLFCRYVKGSKKQLEGEPIRIDTEVTDYKVSKDLSCVTYIKGDEGNLCQSDLSQSVRIASDVNRFLFSSDEARLLYTTRSGGIYIKEGEAEADKIDDDVDQIIYMDKDFNCIYYLKDDAIYKKAIGEEKLKIDGDILSSMGFQVYENGRFYYYKKNIINADASDYFVDDMLESDAKITKPTEPAYSPAPTRDEVDGSLYDNYADLEAACKAAEEKYQNELAEYNAVRRYYYDEYDAQWAEYEDKQTRDEFRKNIENCKLSFETYSLYYFDGTDKVLVSDNIVNTFSGECDVPVIGLRRQDVSKSDKIKMSDILKEHSYMLSSSSTELSEKLVDLLTDTKYYAHKDYCLAIGSSGDIIDVENIYDIIGASSDGSEIFYIANVNYENIGDLYKITVADGKAGAAELYDSEVHYHIDLLSNGKIGYFKNVDEDKNKGDLYINKELYDYDVDVYSLGCIENVDKIIYFKDVSDDIGDDIGDLYIDKECIDYDILCDSDYIIYLEKQNRIFYYSANGYGDDIEAILKTYCLTPEKGSGGAETVAEDVYGEFNVLDDKIMYSSNYSEGRETFTLNLYRNGESVKISDDVSEVIGYSHQDEPKEYYDHYNVKTN